MYEPRGMELRSEGVGANGHNAIAVAYQLAVLRRYWGILVL